MKTTLLFSSISLALMLSLPAQEEQPSMTPGTSDGQTAGSTGFMGGFDLGGDRPKNAKTEITATEQATFDNETSIAEFTGKVVVKDPQFTLFCDRLKVTLGKDRKGLQLVEAFDNVIVVQENTDEAGRPVKSIGRAGRAVFEPESGDVTLTVWPQVQHGINNQVATEQQTIMILNRNGRSKTTGGSKTVIVDAGDAEGTQ
jgi:lipopolysaccharide export system protein LptA